jgi:hypothetical protein
MTEKSKDKTTELEQDADPDRDVENRFTQGQHSHFYGEVHGVTIHNTMHNHYQERPREGRDMKIDLDKKPIPQLEVTQRVKVPCSSELLGLLDTIGRLLKTETPELCYRYIVEGLQRDVGNVFGVQPYLDKPLREVMLQLTSSGF